MQRPDHPNLAILTIGMGAWLFFLSGGVTNIALPYLTAELSVAKADVVWVSVAFQIVAVSLTIPFAGLSEVMGVRKMFVGGLIVFALGSITCALADGFEQLVVARVFQGMGAAAISSVNAALIRRCAPEDRVGLVVGLLAIVVGAAQGAAPIVGSFVLELGGWRWLFLYDLPLTLSAIALALFAIPKDTEFRRDFDGLSAMLTAVTLGAGFYALDRIARSPGNMAAMSILGGALVCGLVLIRRQRGRKRPLFPVDLLRLPHFALPSGISAMSYAAQGLALTALPFYLVSTLDLSLVRAGAMISIMPLATLLVAPLSGVLCDRYPGWPLSAVGCAIMAAGFAGIATTHSQDATVLSALVATLGVGFALFQNHNAKALILGAPLTRMGAAGGVQSTVRVVGMALGPALVGISFQSFGDAGVQVAILIGMGLSLFGAGLAMTVKLLAWRQTGTLEEDHI